MSFFDEESKATTFQEALKMNYTRCKKGPKRLYKFSPKDVFGVVVCNDKFHRIFLGINGKASFKDHNVKELQNIVTMDRLAYRNLSDSVLTGCPLILRGLQELSHGGQDFSSIMRYSPEIAPMINTIVVLQSVGKARKNIRDSAEEHIESGRLENLYNMAVESVKENVVPRLQYRGLTHFHSAEKTVKNGIEYKIEVTSNNLLPVQANGYVFRGKKVNRWTPIDTWAVFDARVNLVWYMKVYKKDLAVIDGMLVLDVIKSFPNGTLLLKVARQGHGFTINIVHAIYDLDRKRLSWVVDENKLETLVEGEKVPRKRRTKEEMNKLRQNVSYPLPNYTTTI